LTDDPDDADTGVAGIARRRAIDAVRARLEEISRLARSEGVVAPDAVGCEPGSDTQAEQGRP
jgi:hypothetical protein